MLIKHDLFSSFHRICRLSMSMQVQGLIIFHTACFSNNRPLSVIFSLKNEVRAKTVGNILKKNENFFVTIKLNENKNTFFLNRIKINTKTS